MTIKLNVLFAATGEGVTVTVWSDSIEEIPHLDHYAGCGCCLTTAILSYRDSLPPYFIIDDETVLYTRDIGLELREPFMTDTSGAPKVFSVC